MVKAALVALCLLAGAARADEKLDVPSMLHQADEAATQGSWGLVRGMTDEILLHAANLPPAELADTHKLAGVAAFYEQRLADAETHFVAYLRTEPDGHLDPALYPPEVREFFDGIHEKHRAELRAARPKARRYVMLNFVPVAGQLQNGDRTKGIVIGSLLGAFLVTNITSYLVLDKWCTQTSMNGMTGATCDDASSNHFHAAQTLRTINLVTGVAAILTYAFGVYDGVNVYRQRTRELSIQPYATSNSVGLVGHF